MGKQAGGDKSSRRDFLKLASVLAPAAVAAAALSGVEAQAGRKPPETSGLQDTAHTRAYFESAKF